MVTVMAMGTLLCFNCCITEQPQPKRRRKIDRTMIGEPTNFRHTSHIGSGDVMSNGSNSSLSNLQDQMSSKSGGDDDVASPVALHLNVMDLPVRKNS